MPFISRGPVLERVEEEVRVPGIGGSPGKHLLKQSWWCGQLVCACLVGVGVCRFDHMSEVWNLLKTSLPEFTLPDLPSDSSVEAVQHLSMVSSDTLSLVSSLSPVTGQ